MTDRIDWICIHCGKAHYDNYEKIDPEKPIKCGHCGLLRKRMGKTERDRRKLWDNTMFKHRIKPFEGTTTTYRTEPPKNNCCCPCPSWYS